MRQASEEYGAGGVPQQAALVDVAGGAPQQTAPANIVRLRAGLCTLI